MYVDLVEQAITDRTRCLLPVHLYGQLTDIERLRQIADEHGLALLEDCAQSHGALRHGRQSGTTGDAAAYSFYPTKVLRSEEHTSELQSRGHLVCRLLL